MNTAEDITAAARCQSYVQRYRRVLASAQVGVNARRQTAVPGGSGIWVVVLTWTVHGVPAHVDKLPRRTAYGRLAVDVVWHVQPVNGVTVPHLTLTDHLQPSFAGIDTIV